jgi:uncharacterized protein YjbI with pentapeptide repeats
LRYGDVRKASFRNADLHGASFFLGDFRDAKFLGNDLRKADLGGCRFEGADFEGVDMKGANIAGARFDGKTEITVEQVKAAVGWENSRYSSELRAELGLPEAAEKPFSVGAPR